MLISLNNDEDIIFMSYFVAHINERHVYIEHMYKEHYVSLPTNTQQMKMQYILMRMMLLSSSLRFVSKYRLLKRLKNPKLLLFMKQGMLMKTMTILKPLMIMESLVEQGNVDKVGHEYGIMEQDSLLVMIIMVIGMLR